MTDRIIRAAIEVHTERGPRLLVYRGIHVDAGYRLDFIVEEAVVVELKAVEGILPLHRAQLLSYLRLGRLPVGLLLNFNVTRMRHGMHRWS